MQLAAVSKHGPPLLFLPPVIKVQEKILAIAVEGLKRGQQHISGH